MAPRILGGAAAIGCTESECGFRLGMKVVYRIEDIEVRSLTRMVPMAVTVTAIGRLLRHASRYIVGKNENVPGGKLCAICSRTNRNAITNRRRDHCGLVGTARRFASRCRSGTLWRRSRQRKI